MARLTSYRDSGLEQRMARLKTSGSLFYQLVSGARALLRRAGLDLVRYPFIPHDHISNYLRLLQIDTVLDVGANRGQYARELRRGSYAGRIISFEPAQESFRLLTIAASGDERWECHRLALGDQDGELSLHIAEASDFSSFLPVLAWTTEADAKAQAYTEECVPVATLDSVWSKLGLLNRRTLLKIDTQGFEGQVLAGAATSLQQVVALQLELSVCSAYEGQPLIEEMLPLLRSRGFALLAVYPGFRDSRSGRLVELDGLFVREV